MNLTLYPDDEKLIKEKLESGQYADARALISDALRALRDREESVENIRKLLDERWEEANDPNTEWIDGEQALARQEARVAEHKKARRKPQ